MALIKFLIRRYDLKNFFLIEITSFFKAKNYLYYFFNNFHHPLTLFLQIFEFLILYFFFSKTGCYFFLNLYYYSTFCKIFLSFNFSYVDYIFDRLTFVYIKKLIILKLGLFNLKFKNLFFKLLLYAAKMRKFLHKNIIFYSFFSLFFYISKFTLLVLVLWRVKSFKLKKFFSFKFFVNSFFFKDKFFLKFFFNFINPVDVSYFIYLVKNYLIINLLNPLLVIHYKLMSIPDTTPTGALSFRWLAYPGIVKLYFFSVRNSYESSIDKKFQARYYYREKMVLSYIKNYFHVYIFFPVKLLVSFVNKVLHFLYNNFFKPQKKPFISFILKVFYIRNSVFTSISVFLKRVFVCFFFLLLIGLSNAHVLSYFIFVYQIVPKVLKAMYFPLPFIKFFFNRLKLKIYDRVWFVPKFLNFGRGIMFKIRFSFDDFYFVPEIFYWLKKTFIQRFQTFVSAKVFVVDKRYAGFWIVFKFLFFLIKFPFVAIKYLGFLFVYCFYWYFFADICFVL